MKNWLNNYFAFTKREYNGLLVLMAILLVLSVFPYVFSMFQTKLENITSTERTALQRLVLVSQQQQNSYTKIRSYRRDNDLAPEVHLFRFDPNRIDVAQWQLLGLSKKQAQAIVNYRNKGGKFYRSQDLQKMYTISPEKYKALLPYVVIENNVSANKEKAPPFSASTAILPKEVPIIELNGADSLELDRLKGIGLAFARRIIKYREKLGGFYQKEQLLEVYGLDSARFNAMKDQLRINQALIKKININTAEFEDLKNHPYLKYKQINALLQYRKQHGRYNNMEDLKKVVILDAQTLKQLEPYLTF